MYESRYQQTKLSIIIGAVANIFQAILKIFFGVIGQSHALFADGIHSLSDLLVDGLVLFAAKVGSRSADFDHPYGHQRIETAATVAIALLLIIAGLAIMYDAAQHLWSGTFEQPHRYVLIIAILSICINEALFHYSLHVGKRADSALLIANAWHHRSDALASLVVLVGVIGATMGWSHFDAIAAIIVGVMVVKMGWELGWSNICELVDTGVDDKTLAQIKQTITSVPGVAAIHQLRTRSMAGNILVDVHVLVANDLSVSEGHYISAKVHEALDENCSKIMDVTVHIDPELDEVAALGVTLPTRAELIPELHKTWQNLKGYKQIEVIRLHYLDSKLYVEVILHLTTELQQTDLKQLALDYSNAIKPLDKVESVKVFFSI